VVDGKMVLSILVVLARWLGVYIGKTSEVWGGISTLPQVSNNRGTYGWLDPLLLESEVIPDENLREGHDD